MCLHRAVIEGSGVGLRVVRERLVLLVTGVGVEDACVAGLGAGGGPGESFFLTQSFRKPRALFCGQSDHHSTSLI